MAKQWTREKPFFLTLDPALQLSLLVFSLVALMLVFFQVPKTENQERNHERDLLGEHSQVSFTLKYRLLGA